MEEEVKKEEEQGEQIEKPEQPDQEVQAEQQSEPEAPAEQPDQEVQAEQQPEPEVPAEQPVEAESTEQPEKAEQAEEKVVEANEEEKPLDKMTTPELKDIAKDIPGVSGVTALRKQELLKIIKEHRGIVDEEPVKKKKKKSNKPEPNLKALKEKIVRLKGEKEAARETKDRKKANIFRRRLNRLKKQARKVAQA